MDKGHPVDIIYLDFAKAFDSISHDKLLHKLTVLGLGDPLLAWITPFLLNRVQQVRVGVSLSHSINVLSGVPQGSVLGPLLFILFIDELLQKGPGPKTFGFADDLKLFGTSGESKHCAEIQSKLDYIVNWSMTWQLPLAAAKCCVMYLGHGNSKYRYMIGNHLVSAVKSTTDLGILFTDDLKFGPHCKKVFVRASQRSHLIFKCFPNSDWQVLKRAFIIYVRPLLEYACEVWNPYLIQDIVTLESVQRRFTKRIPGLESLSYEERLSQLRLDSFETRRLKSQFENLLQTLKWYSVFLFG